MNICVLLVTWFCQTLLLSSSVTGQTCGENINTNRIVNGENADLGSWPWMVIFRARQKRNFGGSCEDSNPSCSGWATMGECQKNSAWMLSNCRSSCNNCPSSTGPASWNCGGVLITDTYVLSAAHCFKNTTQIEFARIGELDLNKDPDTGPIGAAPQPQDITVERVILHPQYRFPCTRCNDIAIVKLARPAQLHKFYVQPVCLPTNPQQNMGYSVSEFQDKDGWATGWGVTDTSTIRQATILQQAQLRIQELPFCRNQKRKYPDGRMVICAGQGDGKDTCRGDSGGPLMLSDSTLEKWYVVGITSFGPATCGQENVQSVYTSVHHYVDWINKNIKL